MDHLSLSHELAWRDIHLSDGLPIESSPYSNYVSIGRYTPLTFLPKKLVEQFLKFSTVWFLFISLVELNPFDLDYKSSFLMIVLTAAYVILGMLKDAYPASKVWRQTWKRNEEIFDVWAGNAFRPKKCKNISVGDTVILRESARVPADLVILATNTDSGICYLNTSVIIGESGYAMKTAVKDTNDFMRNKESPGLFNFSRLNGTVKFEQPNSEFESFSGSLRMQYMPRAIPLRIDNLLLRGGRVHGAEWVLGLVVYVGMDTKIWSCRCSSIKKPSSFSKLLNRWTLLAILCVLLFSSICALIQSQRSETSPTGADFLLYLLMNSGLVSVAMFIALDVVRFAHVMMLMQVNNERRNVMVNSGEMSEDLGKVNYVLADKTGTLTENQLELVAVYIGRNLYTKLIPENLHLVHRQSAYSFLSCDSMIDPPLATIEGDYREGFSFSDLQREMRGPSSPLLHRFCEGLTLCNTVVPHKFGTMISTNVEEEALAKGCDFLGCKLLSRHLNMCDVEFFETCFSYQIICVKKFSPEMRRMRIIVERETDEYATLYIKGAYNALKDFLEIDPVEHGLVESQVNNFKSKGLRTMVLCYRQISGEYLSEIKAQAIGAKLSKDNEEGKLEVLFQELESELKVLAVLGIRDLILPETKEAIQVMKNAGIETWVVSGDSESSTIACAYNLGLIHPTSQLVSLRGAVSSSLCIRKLLQVVNENILHCTPIEMNTSDTEVNKQVLSILEKNFEPESMNFTLSIDGHTVEAALKENDTRKLFACVLFASDMVVFNSMKPNHKRGLVKLLKEELTTSPIVLTVGDDSSDIPMLTEADIGVSVRGRESHQIMYSSDLTINKFFNLAELILRHGKRNSVLLGQTVLLFIHAELLLLFTQVWMSSVSDCTPSSPVTFEMETWYIIAFVSVPIVFVGISNNRLSDKTSFQHTNAFNNSSYTNLNWVNLGLYSLLAAIHFILLSIMIFSSVLYPGFVSTLSQDEFAVIILISCSFVSIQQCEFIVRRKSLKLLAAQGASVLGLIIYLISDSELKPALFHVIASPNLLFGIFGAVGACLIPSSLLSYFIQRKDYQLQTPFFSSKIFTTSTRRSSLTTRINSISTALLNIFRQSSSVAGSKEHSNFEIDYTRATFRFTHTESLFEKEYLTRGSPLFKKLMLIVVLEIFVPIGHHVVDGEPKTASQVALVIACSAGVILYFSFWVRSRVVTSILIFSACFVAATAIIDMIVGTVTGLVYFSVSTGLMLLLREKWLWNLVVSLLSTTLLLLVVIVRVAFMENQREHCLVEAIGYVFAQSIVMVISVVASYHIAIRERKEFALIKQTSEKVSQSDNILKCLLPEFVQKRVKDGIRYIAEDKGSVTVIFIEICDFDEICAAYSPSELLVLLDDIFQKIDLLCQSIRVAKIETVGKVYLACSGLRDFELEVSGEVFHIPHARRALDLAFAILSTFKSYRLVTNKLLQFKIGINTGPVVAGVVGFHKPQFSLVGDTINTASRVCTTIETPNSIHISESTSAVLDSVLGYHFEPRMVTAKGKGELTLFAVSETKRRTAIKSQGHSTVPSSEDLTPQSRINGIKINLWMRFSLLSSVELGELYSKTDRELVEKVKLYNCVESELENSFRIQGAAQSLSRTRLGMRCYLFGIFALLVWRIVSYSTNRKNREIIASVIYFTLLCSTLALRLCIQRCYSKSFFPWIAGVILIATALTVTIDAHFDDIFPTPIIVHILVILELMMFYCSGALFRHCVVVAVLIIGPWAGLELSKDNWQSIVVFFLLNTIQHFLCLYYNEKSERSFFNFSKLAQREIEKTERLLTQMLPIQAYENLKRDEWTNDRLLDVTVLYADISGFTKWSSTRTPQEVIGKLSKIFTAFDRACVQKGLYKVHTIGDCYVTMSATSNSPMRDPLQEAVHMIEFAFEMVHIVRNICAEDKDELNMRIGLHVGEVIAGITGTQAVRYDIYGKGVHVANKMESHGKEGKVNVSGELKVMLEKAIPEGFTFEKNKTVDMTEVGRSVDCYFVQRVAPMQEGEDTR